MNIGTVKSMENFKKYVQKKTLRMTFRKKLLKNTLKTKISETIIEKVNK